MKRYGYPLIVIILGSLFLYLVRTYSFSYYKDTVITVCTSGVLFMFGVYLSTYGHNSSGWVKKFIVMGMFIALILMQLGILKVPYVTPFLARIGITSVIYYMFYIYFGYIFF